MLDRKGWLALALMLASFTAVAAGLVGVSPDQLKALRDSGARLVDIRTPGEWRQTGMVPGSQPLMYFDAQGHYDQAAWLQKLGALPTGKDTPIVLICRSGHRSAEAGKMLVGQGYTHVYHLETGLKGWVSQGNAVSPCPDC